MILRESELYLTRLLGCNNESEIFNVIINQMCILEKQHPNQVPKITLSKINELLHCSNATTRPLGPRVYHPTKEDGVKDSIVYSEGHGYSEINASINILFVNKVSVQSMENSYFIYGPSATTTVTPMSARDNAE
jgi:hypothetical protein